MLNITDILPKWLAPENARILVPALAVILAIIFDLGLFQAVGLAWFSFFTFSEHLLIAIESAPFVVSAVTLFYLNLWLMFFLERMLRRRTGISISYAAAIFSFLLGSSVYAG